MFKKIYIYIVDKAIKTILFLVSYFSFMFSWHNKWSITLFNFITHFALDDVCGCGWHLFNAWRKPKSGTNFSRNWLQRRMNQNGEGIWGGLMHVRITRYVVKPFFVSYRWAFLTSLCMLGVMKTRMSIIFRFRLIYLLFSNNRAEYHKNMAT